MPEDQSIYPLLKEYDEALHAVTEQFRKDHPDWWFWYSAARMKPVAPQKAAAVKHQTEIIKVEPR